MFVSWAGGYHRRPVLVPLLVALADQMQYKEAMNTTTGPNPLPANTGTGAFQSVWGHVPALAILFALSAFPSLYHGIARDVLANSDMDLVSVYQALLVNSGQPLVPNAHTGYVYFLSLAVWFQLFDWLGLVPVHDMGGLLAATDFDATYGALIKAGRWFSVFQAGLLVGLVYGGICTLFKNQGRGRWAGLLLGALFAVGGGGLAAQSVMLRTELPSMILIFGAALALMAAPKGIYRRGLWLLALSGFLVHASLMVKVQNVIVIMFLPLLPLIFGWWERRDPKESPPTMLTRGILATAVVVAAPVAIIFIDSRAPGSYGLYQGLIAAFVIACALIYGQLILGAASHGIVGLAAVVIGFSLAYGLSLFNDNWWTTFALVNFLEHMSLYSSATVQGGGGTGGTGSGGAIGNVARSIAGGFSMAEVSRFVTERLRNIDYPFAVFYALVPAGACVLALRGKWEAAVKAGYLCLMAGLIVVVFWAGRGFFNFLYGVYVEIWVVLAAAIVLQALITVPASTQAGGTMTGRRMGLTALGGLMAAVVVANVAFRLVDPSAANPTTPKSACFIRGLTPLIYEKFDAYCGTGSSSRRTAIPSRSSDTAG